MRVLVAVCLFSIFLPATAAPVDENQEMFDEIRRFLINIAPSRPSPEWRRVTNFGIDDSDCIGRNETPQCTLDTLLASIYRNDYELFKTAAAYKASPSSFKPNWRELLIRDYRIIWFGPFKRSDLPRNMRARWSYRPGDILVGVEERDCLAWNEPDSSGWHCDEPDPRRRRYFYMKPTQGGFRVEDSDFTVY